MQCSGSELPLPPAPPLRQWNGLFAAVDYRATNFQSSVDVIREEVGNIDHALQACPNRLGDVAEKCAQSFRKNTASGNERSPSSA